MAVIPDGIRNMVESVMSYLVTILTILIIVKIIQLVGSIKGGGFNFGGGSGGGSGGGGDKEKKPDGSTNAPTSKQEFIEGQKNPGTVSFLIRNEDDENVKGAELKMWTAKRSKLLFKGSGKYGRTYKDVSNADGMVPSDGGTWNVPSVGYKIQVTYKLQEGEWYKKKPSKNASWQVFKSGKKIRITTDFDVQPGDNGRRTINLPFTGEPQIGFEPRIKDIKYDDGTLTTKGIVKRV